MPKPSKSKRRAVKKVVADALQSASPASVIAALVDMREWTGPLTIQPSVITLKTDTGKQLKVSTLHSRSSSTVELLSRGKTIDAAPTGTFVLSGGKTLAVENGRLVGGTAAAGEMRDWAVFALMPVTGARLK